MLRAAFSLLLIGLLTQTAIAQIITVDVTIEEVKPEAHGITVSYNVGNEKKTITLDVSRKAVITVKGAETTLEGITPGDTAKIEFHKDLAIVTKIEAAGDLLNGWTLQWSGDNSNQPGFPSPENLCLVTTDGKFIFTPFFNYGIFSNRVFSEMAFTVEYRYPALDKISGNGGSLVVAARKNESPGKLPRGIEIKLSPTRGGEFYLPAPDYQAETPLGQIRDGQKITRVRESKIVVGDWNRLEVQCDSHGNVIVKINDVLVNGIKVQSTSGKIAIVPFGSAIHFRNASVTVNGREEKLEAHLTLGGQGDDESG